jgi:hypothetical protein
LARCTSQNVRTSLPVWPVDQHLTIEAPGAEQRRIEYLRAIGRGKNDDADARIEAIHFCEKLIEGLLLLVVAGAGKVDPAGSPQGVELIDEDDGRGLRAGLLEEIAHASGSDADEHLDELRAGNREERDFRFARDGARQRVLPVPGGPTSSTPLGMRAPNRPCVLGSLRKPTTSASSCLASSTPATSANVTLTSRSA